VSEPVNVEQFDGRVAFVTGGAQGIGLGIARALSAAGAKVAIADVDSAGLAAAEQELSGRTDAMAVTLDVRDRDAYARVADAVESRLGPVTLLFNNAGVAGGVAVAQMSYQSWDWVMGINVQGVYNGVQTFVPRMIERGRGGYVVNTASGAGLVATASGFLYTTSKFAVVGLSEALNLELAHHGIGVSVLCPGPVATKIFRNTAALNPDRPAAPPSPDLARRLAAVEAFLAAGTPPDAVGEMVLAAMRAGRLHIYTDDMMEPLIRRRTEQLLAALPRVLQA
jgi:NAD(P)-dependent dehydrogenase (short-subunit alcohol dehydrogenase family)